MKISPSRTTAFLVGLYVRVVAKKLVAKQAKIVKIKDWA
jgi:hypothetical protein